jgi:predicted nucleotidyltransferase component of viral defense system
MQDRKSLEGYARIIGFNLGQAERDYLQHIILQAVSENTGKELVFKGGTSLQKTINMPRYSEDLDFTAIKINTDELCTRMCTRITEKIRYYGYESQYKRIVPAIGETIRFRIHGPLYTGNPLTEASIRLDLSMREKVVLEPEMHAINPAYNDIPPYVIGVMDKREILAEKIRAMTRRRQARDLYDINYLLNKNVKLEKRLLEEKLGYYREKTDFDRIRKSIEDVKNRWTAEMRVLVLKPPEYSEVAKFVLKELKKNLL